MRNLPVRKKLSPVRLGRVGPDRANSRMRLMYFSMPLVTLAQFSLIPGLALPSPRALPFAMALEASLKRESVLAPNTG